MPLLNPPPSSQTRQALADGVPKFAGPDDVFVAALINAPGLRVFTVGLQDLKGIAPDVTGIAGDQPAGWRFLAGAAGQAVAAEVTEPAAGKPPKMRSLSRGPQIDDATQAGSEVETLAEVQNQIYELRVLRIPGLLIEGLWLKSQAGGVDLVAPYLTLNNDLKSKRVFPMNEFLNIVRILAEKLQFDDLPLPV
jgi:hypothetical protein